jgi:hypothetical protein
MNLQSLDKEFICGYYVHPKSPYFGLVEWLGLAHYWSSCQLTSSELLPSIDTRWSPVLIGNEAYLDSHLPLRFLYG